MEKAQLDGHQLHSIFGVTLKPASEIWLFKVETRNYDVGVDTRPCVPWTSLDFVICKMGRP